MTPDQIENWRKFLFGIIGPYALMMPVEQIEAFRDKMQGKIDTLPKEDANAQQ